MNHSETQQPLQDGGSALNVQLDVSASILKAKRRDLARTAIAAFTAVSLAKGMYLAAYNNEIAWGIGFALSSCFWAIGMWQWPDGDG